MKTIIMKFAGPIQSWGVSSNFESRDTARYPAKSAVIGLLAAALGYRRDEDEKIKKLDELSFGVRIEQKGSLLRDFHIAKSTRQSYLTNRYYLQDAVFLAMISHENTVWIDSLEKAIKNPIYPPFMGRRSAPVDSNFFQGVVEKDLISTIKSYDWQASDWYQKKILKERRSNIIILDAYLDANLLAGSTLPIFQRDKLESFAPINRQHTYRTVKSMQVEIEVAAREKNTHHDAFQGIGGI